MLDFFYPWNQSRQDQKLDHDMNQHKERREYYRIQDTLALEFQSVPKEQALAQTPVMPFTLDPRFQVLHALHELDHESHATLRQISDADRHLGSYLRTLNRKIELIAMGMFASSNSEAPSPTHDVTLSESGLSFRHEQPLAPDSHLALKLVLFPAYFGLLLFGRVVQCTPLALPDAGNQSSAAPTARLFNIGVEFTHVQESERELLARYILRKQAQQRREQRNRSKPDSPENG